MSLTPLFPILLILGILSSHPASLHAEEVSPPEKAPPAPSEPLDEAPPSSSAPGTVTLEPVIVTAPRIPSALERIPTAVTVVEQEEIQRGKPNVTLEEALVRAPGVLARNRFNLAQDLRISIRGFGARSAFGIRGIQIYVDGIPLTLPDGQSQVDTLDPETIERIEILRGPISALYGNSSGGVINILTQEGPEEPFAEGRTVVGEFGLWKTLLKGGGQTDRTNYFLQISRLEIDGYREHSEAETWKMTGKLRFDLDDASDLTVLVTSVHSPRLKDPGGLTLQQAEADPRQAAPISLRFDTGEEASGGRLGLVYRRALAPTRNLEAVLHTGLRDLDSAIPFRFIELDRQVLGGRLQFDTMEEILSVTHQVFAGIDIQRQEDDRRNFDNVGGSPGQSLLLDQEERVTAAGAYLQDDIRLTERWSLVAGGRYDRVRFEVDDRLVADGDDTGSKTFDQVTGRLGLNYLPRPGIQMYASVTESFETPTATEIVNRPEGGGGINPDIEPQKAVSYEVGLKGAAAGRFTFDLALFYIQMEDELIAFRDLTDRVFYRNAGESRRTGAEAGLGLEIVEGLEARVAYTWMDAEFETYVKNGEDLEGNQVPGLPNHQIFGEIAYEHPSGFYTGIDVLHVGESFVDDENTLEDGAFTLANLRAGYIREMGHWRLSPFVGVENLLDESYSANVRINAAGGRYFEPAPGLNVYAGAGIGYQW